MMNVTPHEVDLGHPATPEDLLRLAREAVLKTDDEAPVRTRRADLLVEDEIPEVPSPDRSVFKRKQLYRELPSRFQWVPMPGGGEVCVHPLSGNEGLWVQRHVLREMRRSGLLDEAGQFKAGHLAECQAEAMTRGYVWTAVACCREGESLEAPKVFKAEDAGQFYEEAGWMEAAEVIAKVSQRLGLGGPTNDLLQKIIEG
jgi:hypothetical protein